MKLHAWLVGIGLALLLASAAASKPPPETMFDVACRELQVDCGSLPPPVVILTDNPLLLGDVRNLGVYWHGGNTIYINKTRHLVLWDRVILHEIVHYIHDRLKMNRTRCQSEEEARVIAARVFNKEVDPTWRERYMCPAPY